MTISYLNNYTTFSSTNPRTRTDVSIPSDTDFVVAMAVGKLSSGNLVPSTFTIDSKPVEYICSAYHTNIHMYVGFATGVSTGIEKTMYASWPASVSVGIGYMLLFFSGVQPNYIKDYKTVLSNSSGTQYTDYMTCDNTDLLVALGGIYRNISQLIYFNVNSQTSITHTYSDTLQSFMGAGYKGCAGSSIQAAADPSEAGSVFAGLVLRGTQYVPSSGGKWGGTWGRKVA